MIQVTYAQAFLIITLIVLPFVVISIYAFTKASKKSKKLHEYKEAKEEEMRLIFDKMLVSSENNLNLFFKFESALVENLKNGRFIKGEATKMHDLLKEVRLEIEKLKVATIPTVQQEQKGD